MKKKIAIVGWEKNKFLDSIEYINKAEKLAKMLASENFIIITGGNSGIMGSLNKGAYKVNKNLSQLINLNNTSNKQTNVLPENIQTVNTLLEKKKLLQTNIECSVFFPGGIETINEFTELLELYKLNEIIAKPIFLIGYKYWNSLKDWFRFNEIDWPEQYIYCISDNVTEIFDEIMMNITNFNKKWKYPLQKNINDLQVDDDNKQNNPFDFDPNDIDFKLPQMNSDNEIIIEINDDDTLSDIINKMVKSTFTSDLDNNNPFVDLLKPLIPKDPKKLEIDDMMKELIKKFEDDFSNMSKSEPEANSSTEQSSDIIQPTLDSEDNSNTTSSSDIILPVQDPDHGSEISIEIDLMSIDSDSDDNKN